MDLCAIKEGDIMKLTQLKKMGEKLGRVDIAVMIYEIAKDIVEKESPINTMINAGKISEIARAARYDDYFREKVDIGKMDAGYELMYKVSEKKRERNYGKN